MLAQGAKYQKRQSFTNDAASGKNFIARYIWFISNTPPQTISCNIDCWQGWQYFSWHFTNKSFSNSNRYGWNFSQTFSHPHLMYTKSFSPIGPASSEEFADGQQDWHPLCNPLPKAMQEAPHSATGTQPKTEGQRLCGDSYTNMQGRYEFVGYF